MRVPLLSFAESLLPTPTEEQVHAADVSCAGHHLALQADAGTGKATTPALLAASTQCRGRCLAFNKSIARDASARYPRTVQCKTAHATAYAAFGHRSTNRSTAPVSRPGGQHAQLAEAVLPTDEAQDTDPVLEQVFRGQRSHAQLIMVDDSAQAIYGWRGARDVMTGFDAIHLALTQSFRFGPLIAEQANRWLELAGAPIRPTGSETIAARVGDLPARTRCRAVPCRAVPCRTNIGAMTEVMRLLNEGRRVALTRGASALAAPALAARDLQEGRRTAHRLHRPLRQRPRMAHRKNR